MVKTLDPRPYKAALFDLDGVITATTGLHAHAWKLMFDDFLGERARSEGGPMVEFDAVGDYRRFVDGKPRLEGLRGFLASRGFLLPEAELIRLGDRKNASFRDCLERDGVELYASTVALIKELKARGLKVAVVSSSRNGRDLVTRAGIGGLFDCALDGNDVAALGLRGKPEPDSYLEAARRLAVAPAEAMMVEDAIVGVEAGRQGGFGLVIGVDRDRLGAELARHGADLVVTDLGEIVLAS